VLSGSNPNQLIDTSLTPEELAQSLLGPGVEVSNVTFSGGDASTGSFEFTDPTVLGFGRGIVLASGRADDVVGPNQADDTSRDFALPGDHDLDQLSGFDTFDAAVLEFDFVPESNQVVFFYVFASEEYPEYVQTPFNDVFAFFVNGVNYAEVRQTAGDPSAQFVPVAVNNINNSNPTQDPPPDAKRPDLFRANYFNPGGDSVIDLELDGITKVLTFQAPVDAGETNHMKLAIADASDGILDSAVFIQAGSLVSNDNPVADLSLLPESGNAPLVVTAIVEGEDPNGLPLTYSINWGDGTVSTGPLDQPVNDDEKTALVDHTYTIGGEYNVVLTVSNGTLSGTSTEDVDVLGTVGVVGTSGNDTFRVTSDGSTLNVYVNKPPSGPADFTKDLSSPLPFVIDARAGNDSVLINVAGALAGPIHYRAGGGDDQLVIEGGTLQVESTTTGTLNTTVATGAELRTTQLNQHGLTLAEAARVTLLPGGGTSRITSLAIGTGATLDITDNALMVDYTGASPVDTIRDDILTGRGGAGFGKPWDGTGITSSTAAEANVTAPNSRSVGYAENALLPLGAYSSFRGQTADITSVLIAYTRTADANLDGVVNNDDVTIVGANYAPDGSKPAWALGDFDYNGFVDNDDVTLLGVFYNPIAIPAPPPAPLEVGLLAADEALQEAGATDGILGEIFPSRPDTQSAASSAVWESAPTIGPSALPNSAATTPKSLWNKYEDREGVIKLLAESIAGDHSIRSVGLRNARPATTRQPVVAIWPNVE
jgi:PKD repeat protein